MKISPLALGLLLGLPVSAAESAAPQLPPPQRAPAPAPEEPAGTKAEQLAAAQKELAVMRLRHDDKHPVVVKQRAKIAQLHKAVRAEEADKPAGDPAGQLAAAKQDLAKLREKFTDQHPAVIAQQRKVAELERR